MEDLIIGDSSEGSTTRDGLSLDEMRNLLIRARQAYYHGDSPIMSDREYDALEARYAKQRPDCPLLKQVGAPFDPNSMLTKVPHPDFAFNGSQFKITEPVATDFLAWAEKYPKCGYHVSYKADGASLALYYVDGVLVRAVSRGDGVVGEDVTANVVKMKNVPIHLNESFTGQIRAEVVLTLDDWERIDPDMTKNPRNVGNGIMGRSNGHQSEYLTVLATDMRPDGDIWFADASRVGVNVITTERKKFETLEHLGFVTVPWEFVENTAGVIKFYEDTTHLRSSLHFWIDGVVIRIDDLETQEDLGYRDNRPKGQIAWKFKDQGATTTLESVDFTVGHTGAIIPTGNFTPVAIGGTTVSRALLNNWDEIGRLDIAVGDIVHIVKAGDIIPKVVEVVSREDTRQSIKVPDCCPECSGDVVKKGAHHICTNDECGAKSLGKIKRWVKSLNLLNVGDKLLDALFEAKIVRSIPDLYRVDKDTLATTIINESGMQLGDKRADTAYHSIHSHMKLRVAEFFGSLGVPHLGKRRAEKMIEAASELKTPENWINGVLLKVGEKAGVPGVVGEMAAVLTNNPTVKDLMQLIEIDTSEKPDKIEGKTFCITGALPSGRQKTYYKKPLEANGHELVNSVTKQLDYLVVADLSANTGKAKKAKGYGITLITEEELEDYLK
jgi:DNA ligase (NAD+)